MWNISSCFRFFFLIIFHHFLFIQIRFYFFRKGGGIRSAFFWQGSIAWHSKSFFARTRDESRTIQYKEYYWYYWHGKRNKPMIWDLFILQVALVLLRMMFTSSPQSSNATGATTQSFEEEANALTNRILATISGSLSILGSSFIIVTYFLWKDLRSTSRKILGYISFADFCLAASALDGLWHSRMTSSDHPSCKAQSFVTTTASLWSFFWTTFLAVFLYMIVMKKKRREAEIIFKVFHVFGWGIPLVIVGIALGEDKLGNDFDKVTPGWCWINSTEDKIFWMWITGKAWEISSCILCFLLFFLLRLHIRKKVSARLP